MRLSLLAVLVLPLTFLAPNTDPQSLPTKGQANKLLQEAIETQNLESPENPPFHLLAHVRYDFLGKTSEGVYELFWAAPDRFRESFQLDKITETDIALRDKIHVLRNTATLTPQFLHLQSFVHHPLFLYLGSNSTVHKIYSDQIGGTKSTCFGVSKENDDKVCFDPADNKIVSAHIKSGRPAGPYDLDEGDFVSLGKSRYPRQIVRRIHGETMEVTVEKLEEVQNFETDVFTPPANAEARDWCPHRVLKPGYTFQTPPFPTTNPARAFFPYYLLIGVNGHIEKFISLNPSAPPVDGLVAGWIHKAQFPIWVCGSKPIESEHIVMNQ
jgi:hypothetical protein